MASSNKVAWTKHPTYCTNSGLETIVAIVSFGKMFDNSTQSPANLIGYIGLDFILATPDDPISKPLKLALDLTTFLSVGVLYARSLL